MSRADVRFITHTLYPDYYGEDNVCLSLLFYITFFCHLHVHSHIVFNK